MTTLPPSLPAPLPASAPQSVAASAAVLATIVPTAAETAVPAALAALATGATIPAQVRSSADGIVTVALASSGETVALRLALPVADGATLLLQKLAPAPDGTTAALRLLSVDGQPPAVRAPVVATNAPPPSATPATTAAPAADIAMPASSDGIPATLLRPTPALPGAPPAPAAGTTFAVRILAAVPPPMAEAAPLPPPATTDAAPGLRAAGSPATTTPSQPVPAPSSPAPTLAPAVADSGLPSPASAAAAMPPEPAATASSPAPPAGPAPSPPSAASALPALLSGTVAANSNAGQPLIQTALGLIALDAGIDLSPGTRIDLQPVGTAAPPPVGGPAAPPSSGPWPALAEAVAVLVQAAPDAAAHLLGRLPQPDPLLGLTLSALVAQAALGKAGRWLGETAAEPLAKAGRGDLAGAAELEIDTALPPASALPARDDWQAWLVPLLVGGRVERIRLAMRRPPQTEEEKARRDAQGTRFLLDLDLSRTGPMQLDGLVRRQARRFDLIVRTRQELPQPMRRDIRALFATSLEGLGLEGDAAFQETEHFVAVAAAPSPGVTI